MILRSQVKWPTMAPATATWAAFEAGVGQPYSRLGSHNPSQE